MILTSFEIWEYLLDKLFDFKLQGVYLRDFKGFEKFNLLQSPIDDTIMDLSFGLFGLIIYMLFNLIIYKINLKKSRKKISAKYINYNSQN